MLELNYILYRLSQHFPYDPLYDYLKQENAVIPAPVLNGDDPFLTVLEKCFAEKIKWNDHDLIQITYKEKITLQKELVETSKPRARIISKPKAPVTVTQKVATVQEELDRLINSRRPDVEFDRIRQFLRKNPTATDAQAAALTGMHLNKVIACRQLLESIDQEATTNASNMHLPVFPSTKKEDTKNLVQCPKCNSKVRADRLKRHIKRVHTKAAKISRENLSARKRVFDEYKQYRETYRR